MEDLRTLFEIPAENMAKFEAQIAKLSKKSVKLIGSEIRPFTFSHEEKELADGKTHRVYSVMLTAEVPKLNGWTFVARLDHSNDTGTIIRMVPNAGSLPDAYRTAVNTRCDHCNVNRFRRDTFVVRNDETGEFKQVGSTCLKDFFGHDPMKIAKLAELLGYAYECGRGAYQLGSITPQDMRWIAVEEFAVCAARAVLRHGWVSGKAAYENPNLTASREHAWSYFTMDPVAHPFGDAERQLAAEALNWASSLREKTELSDYEHNITVIADATMMEPRSAGLCASIVGVYFNNKARANQGPKTLDVGDFKGVIELMTLGAKNLKWPKIRLALPDGQPIVLSVAGDRSAHKGAVNITDGGSFDNNIWFGRVTPQGEWTKSNAVQGGTMTSLVALLSNLSKDPAGTAAAYGKLTGQCCFCNRGLDDARSTAVGYGKTCAGNYGLPWGAKAMAA
jgi:hypothetical protein